ncbi:MAG: SCO family protein [Anaerolineales bacterium]|nr:SCO family protein [Anaerolineales bacterium]
MSAKRITMLLALLLAAALVAGCAPGSPSLHGSPYQSPGLAPALDLVDTSGKPFNLAGLQGHAVLIYFGYTQCPDECPLTLANAQWAVEQLESQGDRVDFVLVTVDPANDTPDVLRGYLDRFNPRFIGLTGSDTHLSQSRLAYGVLAATPESGHEHTDVIHGTRVYLVAPDGDLATSYDPTIPKEDILADLRLLLETGG